MTVIYQILELACRGFWQFVAVALILGIFSKCILTVWRLGMRTLSVRKSGWPPAHLDADGDFRKESE